MDLIELGQRLRTWKRVVVWTNGCFDLIHAGHIESLQAARALGDALVVGVNSDASVRRRKGPGRPIVPEVERLKMVASLKAVDYATIFDEDDPGRCIGELRPDIHCKGDDYASRDQPLAEAKLVESYGGRVVFLPRVAGVSTTERLRVIRSLSPGGVQ